MRQFQLMSTATTVVASTLHPYYTYSFTVSAVTVGEGPYSQPLSIQTLEDGEKDSYIIMVALLFQGMKILLSSQWSPSVIPSCGYQFH